MWVFRLLVLAMVYMGAITSVPLVWSMADLFMGMMATINLVAIVLLSPFALMLLRDYVAQLKQGKAEPEFKLSKHPQYQDKVKSDIW